MVHSMEEIRTLEEICEKDETGFPIEIMGNVYCSLAMNNQVECSYCSDYRDHNDLFTCTNPAYQAIMSYEEIN